MADDFKIISVLDEQGQNIELKLLDIIEFEGNEYALLLDKDADIESPDSEVILMSLKKGENDEYTFEMIEDDKEFDRISEAILSEVEDSEE